MYIPNSKSSSNKKKHVNYSFQQVGAFSWLTSPISYKKMATSKYTQLYCYLVKEFNTTKNDPITLPFNKIEKILNKLLPQKAKTHGTWWTNSPWWGNGEPSVQAKAWILAGWEPENPNVHSKKITFRRVPLSDERVACQELLKHRYNIG